VVPYILYCVEEGSFHIKGEHGSLIWKSLRTHKITSSAFSGFVSEFCLITKEVQLVGLIIVA
jgi:hypothetical protein